MYQRQASAGERKPEALVARVVPRDEDAAAKQPDKHSTIDRQLEMLVQKRLRELRDAGVIADASPRRALEERPPDRHESDAVSYTHLSGEVPGTAFAWM